MQHPLPVGTTVLVERSNYSKYVTLTRCRGRVGNNKVWRYDTSDGKGASEYQIVRVK